MKHKAPQFELPGAEQTFNLRGQTITDTGSEGIGSSRGIVREYNPDVGTWTPVQFDFSHILSPDPERTHPEIDKP